MNGVLLDVLIAAIGGLLSFWLLIKGADVAVDNCSVIAKRMKISSLVIGLTIVAVGTSLPELSVSTNAAVLNQPGIAISNVIGSNVFNLLVVLGVSALLTQLEVTREVIRRDFPVHLIITAIIGFFMHDGIISHIEGGILLGIFGIYTFWLIKGSRKSDNEQCGEEIEKLGNAIILAIIGFTMIAVGGKVLIKCSTMMISQFGVKDTFIGLFIASIGTSLPELVTSIEAAKKNELEMAIGNAIGSCISNYTLVTGVAAMSNPIWTTQNNFTSLIILAVISVITMVFAYTDKLLSKSEGFTMLFMYAIFVAWGIQH